MIQPASSSRPLVIHGAGGHGRVVADAAEAAGMTLLGYIDDDPRAASVAGRLLEPDDPRLLEAVFICAIGENRARDAGLQRLVEQGRPLTSIIHPTAVVSRYAAIAEACYVGAAAVIGPGAAVGRGAIINTHAVVEHHGRIGACAHVAPRAVLGGNVSVGSRALIGLGSSVLPGLSIGADATVGAGAVVTRAVAEGRVVKGVPARG